MAGSTFDAWWREQSAKGDPAQLDPRTIFEAGKRAGRAVRDEPCGCASRCGDDGDIDGPGTCKGLPSMPEPPLVELVLVPR